jgi:hypothetical protein
MEWPNIERFISFMLERHNIYLRRADGALPPFTDDPVLQKYRFCNVYRELDAVTVWIRKNIREPFSEHPNLWYMLCMARQINYPETLAELMADPVAWPRHTNLGSWCPERARKIMNARKSLGKQVYTGAYMLNTVAKKGSCPPDKPWVTMHLVMGSLLRLVVEIENSLCHSMRQTHEALSKGRGWGGFMAYEAVCDIRHTRYGKNWRDVNKFAHAGPGALRGLNRVAGLGLRNKLLKPVQALYKMIELLGICRSRWPPLSKDWPRLELREIEHSLCEFDKWERVNNGEGRPRSLYKPSTTWSTT